MLSLVEASELTHVPVRTLRRYIYEGHLAAFKVGPKHVRIYADDLQRIIRPIKTAKPPRKRTGDAA